MTFEKRTLADADMGYAVSQLELAGATRAVAASESNGPAVVFDGPKLQPNTLATEPGGTMGFAAVPGRDDAFFAITRFYPIFQADEAGIDLFRSRDGLATPWAGERTVDLPFVHRIASVSTREGDYLLAATVCGGKDSRDDWSRPGAVYAYRIPDDLGGPWEARTILRGIHKNHGMNLGAIAGTRSLLISGEEGLFAVALPESTTGPGTAVEPWHATKLLEREVSEMVLYDFDGDGVDEMAVVAPFHGNEFAVYKERDGVWEQLFSAPLSLGHGLSAGSLNGEPVAVVGNREGEKDLVCFHPTSTDPFDMERIVVDHGPASAGTTVLSTPDGDGIISSNPEFGEYALYLAR
jgi:hypothetical protein